MAESQVISTSRSSDLVTFSILSDGVQVSDSAQVLSITTWQELNRVPKAKLRIADGDPASSDFPLSAGETFQPGAVIEIKAGYHSDEETIFKGIVTKHSISVKSGSSYLTVECQHESVKMTTLKKNRYFYQSTESDIWQNVLSEYGIAGQIESTSFSHESILQFECSDWDFMVTRAELNGLFVVADHEKVNVAKPDFDQDAAEKVNFGSTMLSLDAEIDACPQVSKVLGRTWDFSKTEITEVEAEDPKALSPGNFTPQDLSAVFDDQELVLYSSAKQYDEMVQEWADSTRMRRDLSKVRGRARFQGIPTLKAGLVIELQGLGDRFNGKAFVSAVRHQLGAGQWSVDIQFGLAPESYADRFKISPQPAAGMLSAISGLQVALVTKIEGDPDGDERVMVNLPTIDSSESGTWARLATMGAGDSRGMICRPEIGDEVIVGFINDDPNHPVILGALNSTNHPSPIPPSDDNHEKGWVTRGEISMILDDDLKTVTVSLPSGREVRLSDDDEAIELRDGDGNSIRMDSDGITLKSAKDLIVDASMGDIKMECKNAETKASIAALLEGATAEVKGSGTTTISGGLVQIN